MAKDPLAGLTPAEKKVARNSIKRGASPTKAAAGARKFMRNAKRRGKKRG